MSDTSRPLQRHIAWLHISFGILITDNVQSQNLDPYAKCDCETSTFNPTAVLADNDLVAIGKVISIEKTIETINYSNCYKHISTPPQQATEQHPGSLKNKRLLGVEIDGKKIAGACDMAEIETINTVTTIGFDYEYLGPRPEGALMIKQLFSSPCNNRFELNQSYLVIANYTDTYLRFTNPDGTRHAGNVRITSDTVDSGTSLDNSIRQDYLVTNRCMGTTEASEVTEKILALRTSGNDLQ